MVLIKYHFVLLAVLPMWKYMPEIVLGPDCDIDVREGEYVGPSECIIWDEGTSDTIGECDIVDCIYFE